MKNLKKTGLLAIVLLMVHVSAVLASPTDASDTYLRVYQIKSENKKAVIRIVNLPEDQKVCLRIRAKDGQIVYREWISQQQAFAKRYDFSKLPAGEYRVELKTKEGVITETFALESGKTQPMYFKPAIQIEPGMIKVAFLNRIDSPVSLKLYDPMNRVIYEQKVLSQEKYMKGLNVSRLPAGSYSLAITGDNYVYSKSIQVR